jgi:hypothetical protein
LFWQKASYALFSPLATKKLILTTGSISLLKLIEIQGDMDKPKQEKGQGNLKFTGGSQGI